MNTKTITDKALSVIDQYLHFSIAHAVTSIPYYNNRHSGARASLRALHGKGSPHDIFEESEIIFAKNKIDATTLTGEELKHALVEHNIGIDCSGFAYYVLNAESQARGKGSLDMHLHFVYSKGIIGRIRSAIRPAENTDVLTLAHDKNSKAISMLEAQPGDIITMVDMGVDMSKSASADTGTGTGTSTAEVTKKISNHILVIHQIIYQNFIPIALHYSHSIAWPTDGEFGHGVRQGVIEITDPKQPLTKQRWIENGTTESTDNFTLARALSTRTEVRRMLSL